MEPFSPDGPDRKSTSQTSVRSNRLLPLPDDPDKASRSPGDNWKLIFFQIQLPETLRLRFSTDSTAADFWLVPVEEMSLECIA
ncbi:MAG: hypothetical protein MAG581_02677 [Deltaproteobacteria bacterium]|nr:hypothetical protein [Deltaproteobacteria bacterium]